MNEKELQQLVAQRMENEQLQVDQVFDELGRREMAYEQGLTEQAADPNAFPDPPADATLMGPADTFAEFGKRMWQKYEPQLYDLLCNAENEKHDEMMDALKAGSKALAMALVPALMAQLAALPAFVVVLATIAGKQIAKTGLETACEMWGEARAKPDAAVETPEEPAAEPAPAAPPAGAQPAAPTDQELYDRGD